MGAKQRKRVRWTRVEVGEGEDEVDVGMGGEVGEGSVVWRKGGRRVEGDRKRSRASESGSDESDEEEDELDSNSLSSTTTTYVSPPTLPPLLFRR